MVCQRVDANRETGVESGSDAGARWWNRERGSREEPDAQISPST